MAASEGAIAYAECKFKRIRSSSHSEEDSVRRLRITADYAYFRVCAAAHTRKGLDGLQGVCRQRLGQDPLSGTVFAFRNRSGTALRLLVFDGTGSWLLHKRFSQGKLRWWPTDTSAPAQHLAARELAVILYAGDPSRASFSPDWRKLA